MAQLQLSQEEKRLSDKFREKHRKCCNSGAVYTLDRISGIGWGISIHCRVCKKFRDITDVSDW